MTAPNTDSNFEQDPYMQQPEQTPYGANPDQPNPMLPNQGVPLQMPTGIPTPQPQFPATNPPQPQMPMPPALQQPAQPMPTMPYSPRYPAPIKPLSHDGRFWGGIVIGLLFGIVITFFGLLAIGIADDSSGNNSSYSSSDGSGDDDDDDSSDYQEYKSGSHADINDRGNIPIKVGEKSTILGKDDEELASWTVTKITPDTTCTASTAQKPTNGHFLELKIDARISSDYGNSIRFTIGNAPAWSYINADGTVNTTNLATSAAYSCLNYDDEFPIFPTPDAKSTGSVVLDVPNTDGSLVYHGYTSEGPNSWEYPIKQQ